MLGKLIKYEFRSTAAFFLPIYAALVVISGLTAILYRMQRGFDNNFFNFSLTISVSLYVLLAIGLAITTFVIVIIRFYKNLLGNEGYLMFTLPVTAEQNILAKLIPAATWFIGSVVLGFLTIIPVLNFRYKDFAFTFEHVSEAHLTAAGIALAAIGCIIAVLCGFLFLYLCMCIGQLFNAHRFIASAVTYIVIQSALQIISIAVIFVLSSNFGDRLLEFAEKIICVNGDLSAAGILSLLAIADIIGGAITAGIFFLDSYILRKKLNLI